MLNISEIEKSLMEKEAVMDELIRKNREIVRMTANSIKEMHAGKLEEAEKLLSAARGELDALNARVSGHELETGHIMQEYAEAAILLAAIRKQDLPSSKDLDVSYEAYLCGLLDCVGELKREMYERLRKRDKAEAERYFGLMEKIFDELLPLKFSNALMHDFRRKQDAARIQIEQARGELL
jgi:translin